MINDRPRRIYLKKTSDPQYDEGRAGAVITPGMLIKLNNAGVYVPHNVSGQVAARQFALEDALIGKTIDDNYASGDLVRFTHHLPGDHVLAILQAGQNVQDGTRLVSGGDGTLIAGDTDSDAIAVALEDRNAAATDQSLEARRIRVEII
jgi:hypothetical protein